MRVRGAAGALVAALTLVGCNTIDVRQVQAKEPIGLVCILFNEDVAVRDFVDVLQAGFSRHEIRSQVVRGSAGPECDATLTYTAERSWDFVPYLSLAELHLWQRGVEVGRVYYRHRNGMSLVKWAGTDTKMDPLIDQLLAGVQTKPAIEAAISSPATPTATPALAPTEQAPCKACAQIGKGK